MRTRTTLHRKSRWLVMLLLALAGAAWWPGARVEVEAGELRIGDIVITGQLHAEAFVTNCVPPPQEEPVFVEQVVELPATEASASASLSCNPT